MFKSTPRSLDEYYSNSSEIGNLKREVSEVFYGINNNYTETPLPRNKDYDALLFMVRPQLNLTSANIRNNRLFYSLMTKVPLSMHRYVRCILDPRLMNISGEVEVDPVGNTSKASDGLKCPLVDNTNPFIPIVSNTFRSISGWPDVTLPTYTSGNGIYKQQYSQADGVTLNYESFDLDLSFRNMIGDPVIYLMYIWLHYMSSVFEGRLMPYMDFIVENELDYNTRIYKLTLDVSHTYVKKIAATGASFPISVPTGQFFDSNRDKPYNDQTDEFSIRFRNVGAQYNDDILIKEFNETVNIFNPLMRETFKGRLDNSTKPSDSIIKIPKKLRIFFKNKGVPRIDQTTNELDWFIPKRWIP